MVHQLRAEIILSAQMTLAKLAARKDLQTRRTIVIVRHFEKRLNQRMEEST